MITLRHLHYRHMTPSNIFPGTRLHNSIAGKNVGGKKEKKCPYFTFNCRKELHKIWSIQLPNVNVIGFHWWWLKQLKSLHLQFSLRDKNSLLFRPSNICRLSRAQKFNTNFWHYWLVSLQFLSLFFFELPVLLTAETGCKRKEVSSSRLLAILHRLHNCRQADYLKTKSTIKVIIFIIEFL